MPGALTANAYLGAFGIAECLRAGADVVVTGRVTDASLVVGPAIAHFGWTRDDLDALAGATVAGHILECGAQATGGNFSFFTELPDRRPPARLPARRAARRRVGASSPSTPGTGGAVTVETVTAQLLYEIGAPRVPRARRRRPVRHDRAARRRARPGPGRGRTRACRRRTRSRSGVNTLGGYRNAMSFVLCGLDIEEKAALVREQLEAAVGTEGLTWRLARTDHPDADTEEAASALLTVHIHDQDQARAGRRVLAGRGRAGPRLLPGLHADHAAGRRQPVRRVPGRVPAPGRGRAHRRAARRHPGRRSPPPATGRLVPLHSDGPRSGEPPDRPATRRVPLGTVVGARSGDKGGDANLGVWARSDAGYAWLRDYLTVDELKRLLPECAPLDRRAVRPAEPARGQLRHRRAARRGGGRLDPVRPAGQGARRVAALALVDVPEELL